jgi:hypothetical protein
MKIDLKEIGYMRVWNGFTGSEQGPVAGSYEHGNESCGFLKNRATISFSIRALIHADGGK